VRGSQILRGNTRYCQPERLLYSKCFASNRWQTLNSRLEHIIIQAYYIMFFKTNYLTVVRALYNICMLWYLACVLCHANRYMNDTYLQDNICYITYASCAVHYILVNKIIYSYDLHNKVH